MYLVDIYYSALLVRTHKVPVSAAPCMQVLECTASIYLQGTYLGCTWQIYTRAPRQYAHTRYRYQQYLVCKYQSAPLVSIYKALISDVPGRYILERIASTHTQGIGISSTLYACTQVFRQYLYTRYIFHRYLVCICQIKSLVSKYQRHGSLTSCMHLGRPAPNTYDGPTCFPGIDVQARHSRSGLYVCTREWSQSPRTRYTNELVCYYK